MNNVDKRVVEMQFDNQQFEKGIKTSINSLDSLKKGLDLEKSAKSLSSLEKAGRSFSLAGLADSVGVISSRFSTMGIIGVTALQNITNAAINASKKMVAALTTDPIKMGFSEYETQINSVQTILANTSAEMDKAGYTQQQRLDIVNGKLDELNTYADKTIYNFTEMTRNIGTFTAAGVDLDKSVSSIKGIANLAAVSGSTSQQASTAMYQLSQAISTGTVRLMDWNSVVNAGMGGKVFQDALIRTASRMGVVGEEAKEAFAQLEAGQLSFRDSLSSGWLSSDILTSTLSQMAMDFESIAESQGITVEAAKELKKAELLAEGYTGAQADEIIALAETASEAATKVKTFTQLFDTMKEAVQSGWTQSWEIIVGDFEESKELLTSISDYFGEIISKSAQTRNAMLQAWADKGGRQDIIDSFWLLVDAIENVVSTAKNAFSEFFPPMTADRLFSITSMFKSLAERIKVFTENGENMSKISRVVKGFASGLKMASKVGNGFWKIFKKIASLLGPHFLDALAYIGDRLVEFGSAFEKSTFFDDAVGGIDSLYKTISEVIPAIQKYIDKLFSSFEESDFYKNTLIPLLTNFREFFTDLKQSIKDSVNVDTSAITGLWEKIKTRFGAIATVFKEFSEKMEPYIEKLKGYNILGVIASILGIFILFKLYKGVNSISNIVGSITDVIGEIGTAIGDLGTKLKNNSWFVKSQSILMLAGAIWLIGDTFGKLGKMNWEELAKGAIGLITAIGGILVASKFISAVGMGTGIGLLGIGITIAIFADSLSKLGDISWEGVGTGVTSLTVIMGELITFVKLATTDPSVKQFSGLKLIGLGIAVAIFAETLSTLGNLSWEQIGSGATALTVIMGELIAFVKLAATDPSVKQFSALKLLGLGFAVKVFADTLSVLGAMSWDSIGKGVVALTGIMGELIAFIKLGGVADGSSLADVGMLFGLGDAVKNMGEALASLGVMSWEQIGAGVSALTVIMGELIAFVKLATTDPSVKQFSGLKLIGLGAAVLIFAESLTKLSTLTWDGIATSVTSLTVVMSELIIFTKLATTDPSVKQFSGLKLIGLSASVLLFAESLTKLSTLTWDGIATGVTSLTAIMGELIIFTKLATTDPSVKQFSGVKLILLGGAVLLFSEALSKLASFSWEEIGKGVTGLTAVMGEMIAFTKLAQGIKISSMLSIVPMVAGIAALAVALNHVKDIDWEVMAAFSAGLSAIMLSLAASMGIMSALPITGILKGAAGLIVAAGAIGLAVNILGKLVGDAFSGFSEEVYKVGANIKGYSNIVADLDTEAINTSITVMKDLGGVAVEIGSKDYSGLDAFSSSITTLGANLNLYSNLVSGLTIDGSAVAKSMVDDIGYIGRKMNELSSAGVDADSLGIVLANIGSGLKLYNESIAGFSISNETGSTTYIKQAFDDLANNLPSSEAIARISSYAEGGGNNMTSYALGLTAIGSAIDSFSTSVQNINADKVTNAENVISILSSISSGLTSYGGIFEFFTGKKQTLSDFSTDIVTVGGAISSFATSIGGVDQTKVDGAVNTISMLSEIQTGLDTDGGIWGFITGNKDLATFGTKLNTLGLALKGFSDNISTVDTDQLTKATAPIDALVSIQSKLEDTGGMAQWFSGKQDLGAFGTSLTKFGENLASFATHINGITFGENSESIMLVIEDFAAIAERMALLEDVYDLSDYIKWLGVDLKSFFEDVEDIDTSNSTALSTFINSIADAAIKLQGVKIDEWALTSLLTSLTMPEMPDDGYAGLLSQISTQLDAIVAIITGKRRAFKSAGTVLGNAIVMAIVETIQNGKNSIENAASGISNDGYNAVRSTYDGWYKAGQHVGNGLLRGLNSKADSIYSAARTIANNALNAVRRAWDEHSPSKKFEQASMYADEGMAIGFIKNARIVETSAADVAKRAVNSAKAMLTGFTSTVTDGIDATPTIRPVLDLTNVTNGVHMLNGMFNADRSMNASVFAGTLFGRNASNLAFDGNRIVGSTNNKDVVAAINDLSDRFNQLSEAVGNINLVLDTGTLVGQLDTKIDKQLGVLAGRRERGN